MWDASLLSEGDPNTLFELIEELAVGSYGTVYKAIHGPTGDTVALKIIKIEEDDTLDAMVDEVRIMKMCSHPNIVRFYGAWKTHEELFIAMELCGGGSVLDLYQVLKKPLSEAQISLIARDTLSALEYMHDTLNIMHRDIKAANLLLTDEGKLKLTDFGVSVIRKTKNERRTSIIGTPYWMAPEVCRGSFYDEKCDIWSVGVVCLELSELIWPLSDLPAMQALVELMQGYVPRLKEPQKWSADFVSFVNECLEPDPVKRKRAAELLRHPFMAPRIASASPSSPTVPEPEKVKQEIKMEIETARRVEETYAKTAQPIAQDDDDDEQPSSPHNANNSSTAATSAAAAPAVPKLPSVPAPSAAGTPTRRTTRKPKTLVTLKRGNLPDNVEIKRLVKNQLRLLKKLQQRHHLEREDLTKNHQMRVQKLESKSAADFLALTEEQKSEFKRIKDKHEADIADLRARNDAELQALRVAQEEDLRKKAQQLAAQAKKQLQSPPKGVDPQEYERTLQLEEHRALAQYGAEQLQAVHKLARELEKKLFQLKIANSAAFPAVMHQHNDDVYKAQIHYLESEYAEKSQQQHEMQKLLVSQATAEHRFLAEQQGEQLAMEHKFKVKDWKAKQKEESKQIELLRKDPSRDKKEAARLADERKRELERHDEQFVKGLKQQQEEMRRTLDTRLNERLNNFKQRATKEKAETAKVFLAKYKTLKEEHCAQQLVYNENRSKNFENLFAEQKARDESIIEKQFVEHRLFLENKFKDELRLLQEQLKQRNQSGEEFTALLDKLQLGHDTAMTELQQQKQFLQSQVVERLRGESLGKESSEAAKTAKKAAKDKKDRSTHAFKENLKRLLLPTSAAEIEEYKKNMRAAYEAQQQQKSSSPALIVTASARVDEAAPTSSSSDLTSSMSMPLDVSSRSSTDGVLTRSFKPEPPSEPRPDRRSKTYTLEQVQEAHAKEKKERRSQDEGKDGEKKAKKESKLLDSREKEIKESTRQSKHSTPEKRHSASATSDTRDTLHESTSAGHRRTPSASGAKQTSRKDEKKP